MHYRRVQRSRGSSTTSLLLNLTWTRPPTNEADVRGRKLGRERRKVRVGKDQQALHSEQSSDEVRPRNHALQVAGALAVEEELGCVVHALVVHLLPLLAGLTTLAFQSNDPCVATAFLIETLKHLGPAGSKRQDAAIRLGTFPCFVATALCLTNRRKFQETGDHPHI